MLVTLLPEAEQERLALSEGERRALDVAIDKLEALDERLRFPHTSAIKGATKLRELRPRAGRSPWRAFSRRVERRWIVAAIGPEAQVDPLGFRRAVQLAEQRLATLR